MIAASIARTTNDVAQKVYVIRILSVLMTFALLCCAIWNAKLLVVVAWISNDNFSNVSQHP
jgi:hypothetical protein